MEPRPRYRDDVDVDRQLEQIDRYWITQDVPEAERHERLHELCGHIELAVAEGRTPGEVLGPDPVGLAAQWHSAGHRYSWVRPALVLPATLALYLGLGMIIWRLAPWGDGEGMPQHTLGFAVLVAVFVAAQDVLRGHRDRLSSGTTRAIGLAGLVVLVAGHIVIALAVDGRLAPVPWSLPISLVVVGGALVALQIWWARRTASSPRRVGRRGGEE